MATTMDILFQQFKFLLFQKEYKRNGLLEK